MESTRRMEIKVGLLLVIALAAVVTLILFSDRVDFESRYRVAAYLPDAGGLLQGSPVTLSGIRIGRVAGIYPDSTGRNAIRVEMDILASYDIPQNASLTLSSSGILGDTYLAFAAPSTDPGPSLPKDGSAKVDGQPGFLADIAMQARSAMESVNAVLNEESRNDLRRILSAAAESMEQGALLLTELRTRQQQMGNLIDRLDSSIASSTRVVESLGTQVESSLAEVRGLLLELRSSLALLTPLTQDALSRAGQLVERVDHSLHRLDAMLLNEDGDAGILVDTQRTLSALAEVSEDLHAGRGVLGQLLRSQDLARDLNAIAIDLTTTAEMIADKPSVLVWGPGSQRSTESEQRRISLRQRRAFMEGLRFEQDMDEAESSSR